MITETRRDTEWDHIWMSECGKQISQRVILKPGLVATVYKLD